MPTIFVAEGFRFFFYSNDHEPMHVHVRKGGAEAVFLVGSDIELRESVGLKLQELRKAQQLAQNRRADIVRSWNEYFG